MEKYARIRRPGVRCISDNVLFELLLVIQEIYGNVRDSITGLKNFATHF